MKRHKTFEIEIVDKNDDGGEIVINTDSIDRDRDRVFPSGANVADYLRNPVVQFGHRYNEPWSTIGKTTTLEISETSIAASFDLRPAANEYDPQNIVRLLWAGDWIRTASIGFMPDPDAMEENEFGGIDFKQWDLLEWSLVPIPANQDALRMAIKSLGFNRSVLDMTPVTVTADQLLRVEPDGEPDVVTNPQTKIKSKLYVVAFPVDADPDVILRVVDTADDVPEPEPEIRGVIPYKRTPLAPKDASWDGPSQIRAADVDTLRIICTWFDNDNADVKSGYKLPHHYAAGEHSVVWRGVTAAMGALLGARGGVNIPDGDRRGVYNHLSRHYGDFDEEPPEFRDYDDDELKSIFPELYEPDDELNGRDVGDSPTETDGDVGDIEPNNDPTSNNEPNNHEQLDGDDERDLVLGLAQLAETLKQI